MLFLILFHSFILVHVFISLGRLIFITSCMLFNSIII
jgi:hypothetical protein